MEIQKGIQKDAWGDMMDQIPLVPGRKKGMRRAHVWVFQSRAERKKQNAMESG